MKLTNKDLKVIAKDIQKYICECENEKKQKKLASQTKHECELYLKMKETDKQKLVRDMFIEIIENNFIIQTDELDIWQLTSIAYHIDNEFYVKVYNYTCKINNEFKDF